MNPGSPLQPSRQNVPYTQRSSPVHVDSRSHVHSTSVASRQATCGARAPQVLLAEDDQEMRTVLRSNLTKCGCAVTECTDGLDLLNELGSFLIPRDEMPSEHKDFDVIISDIRMPGASGLEILNGMAQSSKLPPVILMTAFADQQIHKEAVRLGAVAVFDKPFDMNELMTKVLDILSAESSS